MSFRVEIDVQGQTYDVGRHEGTLEEGLSFFGGPLPSERAFPLAFRVRDESIDIRPVIVAQHGLDQATGRVYREDGTLALQGQLREVEWRAQGSMIRCTIQESTRTGETIDPQGETAAEGGPYPLVWGRPGWDGPSSPAKLKFLGGATRHVIAGHTLASAGAVTIHGQDEDGVWQSVDVFPDPAEDEDGRVVTVVNVTTQINGGPNNIPPPIWTLETELFTEWQAPARRSGLGRFLREMLREVPWLVDIERLSAATPYLDSFEVDTWLDAPIDSLDLLTSVLEPFPVSVVQGRGGVYVWAWDPDAHVVADLVVGEDHIVATADARCDGEPVRSAVIEYREQETSKGNPTRTTEAFTAYHRVAAQNTYGEDYRLTASHISSASTAQRCVDLRVRARARPPIVVSLEVPSSLGLRAGDCVRVRWDLAAMYSLRRGWVTLVTEDGTGVDEVEVTIPYSLEP